MYLFSTFSEHRLHETMNIQIQPIFFITVICYSNFLIEITFGQWPHLIEAFKGF